MKETKKSLKYYFYAIGIIGFLGQIYNLFLIYQKQYESIHSSSVTLLLVISSLLGSLILIYIGHNLEELLKIN